MVDELPKVVPGHCGDSVAVEDRHEPAGEDGKRQARDHAHEDEAPPHQRRFPCDDALVAYMTSLLLFGMQRVLYCEGPLMGWRFVFVRVIPSLAFPVLAGWLVAVFYRD